jgi:hypothetical protein
MRGGGASYDMPATSSQSRIRTARSSSRSRTGGGNQNDGSRSPVVIQQGAASGRSGYSTERRNQQTLDFLAREKDREGMSSRKPAQTLEERLLKDARGSKKHAAHGMHKDLMHLVDIDGDGHIDAEEFKLYEKLRHVHAKDIDGDGIIDEQEHRVAREAAGRRIMSEDFVKRNAGGMWQYGNEYCHKNDDELLHQIANEKYFSSTMKRLKGRERLVRLSGSRGVLGTIKMPRSGRQETGRNVDLSLTNSSDIAYHVDRRRPKENYSKTEALNSSGSWKSGGFKTRAREDILFSARKERVTSYNMNRGDIKGYGNFTQYRNALIRQGTAAGR